MCCKYLFCSCWLLKSSDWQRRDFAPVTEVVLKPCPDLVLTCVNTRSEPHSEVVWAASGRILFAVCMYMCPGPHLTLPTQLMSSLWVEACAPYNGAINNNNRQFLWIEYTWNSLSDSHLGLRTSTIETGWFTSQPGDLWGHLEKDGGKELPSIMAATPT